MRVKCFACDAQIEADDADALVRAFVAHGQDSHAWSYPEEAVRNYARNYGEATERLTGGTERLSEIADVEVHPMTENRIDDWLRLFDHDAFADRQRRRCLSEHGGAHARPWPVDFGAPRLSGISRMSTTGPWGGSTPHSAPNMYGLYQLVDPDGPEPRSVIGVSCFVIAPPFRRHGVASALLDRVIADASSRGGPSTLCPRRRG